MDCRPAQPQEVMISHLPLLFAHQYPTSLDRMSLIELQHFIPFMLRCSLGQNITNWENIPQPDWWPPNVPFSRSILENREPAEQLRITLMNMVQRCYTYYECEYLLVFCEQLMEQEHNGFLFRNNWDGTTSLYDQQYAKLLVTFRNENREYDRRFYEPTASSPRRTLLLRPTLNTSSYSSQQPIVIPNRQYDVFLCENCDSEFRSLSEIKEHEKRCVNIRASSTPPPPSPGSDHFEEVLDQPSFLAQFRLKERDSNTTEQRTSPKKLDLSKRGYGSNYSRYCTVAVSSPLGLRIMNFAKIGAVGNALAAVDRYERFCVPNPRAKAPQDERWPNTFRNKKQWYHIYCFNRQQKEEKWKTIATGLDKRSRQLKRMCKTAKVYVEKLTPRSIASIQEMLREAGIRRRMQTVPPPSLPCVPVIDLCSSSDEEDEIARACASMPVLSTVVTNKFYCEPYPKKTVLNATHMSQNTKPIEMVYVTEASLATRSMFNPEIFRVAPKTASPPKELRLLIQDECKELKSRGLQTLLGRQDTTLRPKNMNVHPVNRIQSQ